jgi:hypothetical protein
MLFSPVVVSVVAPLVGAGLRLREALLLRSVQPLDGTHSYMVIPWKNRQTQEAIVTPR